MWPYLGLRESPRNLLRGAPHGLGNVDAVYFLHNPGCLAGQTPGTGVPAPIGRCRKTWAEKSVGLTGNGTFSGPVGTTISPQCPLGIPGCVQEPFVSPVLPGVTLKYSAVPQANPCKEQGWEEAGAEQDPHDPKSCWIQVGLG